MIYSTAFAAGLALLSMQQVRDASTTARDAYTACLNRYKTESITGRVALDAFRAAIPQQCQPELTAYRNALTTRERGFDARATAAQIEEAVHAEVEDAQANVISLFEMAVTPR